MADPLKDTADKFKDLSKQITDINKAFKENKASLEDLQKTYDNMHKKARSLYTQSHESGVKDVAIRAKQKAATKEFAAEMGKANSVFVIYNKRQKEMGEMIEVATARQLGYTRAMSSVRVAANGLLGTFTKLSGAFGFTGISAKSLLDVLDKYSTSFVTMSKQSNMLGVGITNIDQRISKLTDTMIVSKAEFMDLVSTMMSGFAGLPPSIDRIARTFEFLTDNMGTMATQMMNDLSAIGGKAPEVTKAFMSYADAVKRGDPSKSLLNQKTQVLSLAKSYGLSTQEIEKLAMGMTKMSAEEKANMDIAVKRQRAMKEMKDALLDVAIAAKPLLEILTKIVDTMGKMGGGGMITAMAGLKGLSALAGSKTVGAMLTAKFGSGVAQTAAKSALASSPMGVVGGAVGKAAAPLLAGIGPALPIILPIIAAAIVGGVAWSIFKRKRDSEARSKTEEWKTQQQSGGRTVSAVEELAKFRGEQKKFTSNTFKKGAIDIATLGPLAPTKWAIEAMVKNINKKKEYKQMVNTTEQDVVKQYSAYGAEEKIQEKIAEATLKNNGKNIEEKERLKIIQEVRSESEALAEEARLYRDPLIKANRELDGIKAQYELIVGFQTQLNNLFAQYKGMADNFNVADTASIEKMIQSSKKRMAATEGKFGKSGALAGVQLTASATSLGDMGQSALMKDFTELAKQAETLDIKDSNAVKSYASALGDKVAEATEFYNDYIKKEEAEIRKAMEEYVKANGGNADTDAGRNAILDKSPELRNRQGRLNTANAAKQAMLAQGGGAVDDLTNYAKEQEITIKGRLSLLTEEGDKQKTIISMTQERLNAEKELIEAGQFGMGASITMMQKQVDLMYEMISASEANIQNIRESMGAQLESLNIANKADKERLLNTKSMTEFSALLNKNGITEIAVVGELTQKKKKELEEDKNILQQRKGILDITKDVREGYLDALRAQASNFGNFAKIIGTQDVAFSQLIRTTKETTGENVLNTFKGGGVASSGSSGRREVAGRYTTRGAQFGNRTGADNRDIYAYKESLDKVMTSKDSTVGITENDADLAVLREGGRDASLYIVNGAKEAAEIQIETARKIARMEADSKNMPNRPDNSPNASNEAQAMGVGLSGASTTTSGPSARVMQPVGGQGAARSGGFTGLSKDEVDKLRNRQKLSTMNEKDFAELQNKANRSSEEMEAYIKEERLQSLDYNVQKLREKEIADKNAAPAKQEEKRIPSPPTEQGKKQKAIKEEFMKPGAFEQTVLTNNAQRAASALGGGMLNNLMTADSMFQGGSGNMSYSPENSGFGVSFASQSKAGEAPQRVTIEFGPGADAIAKTLQMVVRDRIRSDTTTMQA